MKLYPSKPKPKLMKAFIILLSFLWLSINGYAQTYLIPHITYNRFQLKSDNMISKWHITGDAYWEESGGFGLALRHEKKKFYLQVGLNYADHMDNAGSLNTNREIFPLPPFPNGDIITLREHIGKIGTTLRMIRLEMPLMVGTSLLKYGKLNFRVMAGLIPSYRFKIDIVNWTRTPADFSSPQEYAVSRQHMVWNIVGNMYVPFALDATVGFGVDLGRFTFDVRRTEGLTNLGRDVIFEGQKYNFKWQSSQLNFILGWKFRVDKNRPRRTKVKG